MLKINRKLIVWLLCALMVALAVAPGCSSKAVSSTVSQSPTLITSTAVPTMNYSSSGISHQEVLALIDRTKAYQAEGGVYQADSYKVVKLNKGDIIYGMLPGQAVWYTDQSTLDSAKNSYKVMYQLLQIRPHPVYGYRTKVGKYEALTDMYVTAGTCHANQEITVDGKTENLGSGGGYQYVVFDYADKLKLLEEITLNE